MKIHFHQTDNCLIEAQLEDYAGLIGPVVSASSYEDAAFLLGAAYGRHPQDFSRPLEEIETPVENI